MEAPVQNGEILASKYRVETVLGAGAMGVVVAARHVQLGSRVALKFMSREALRVPEAATRFMREARAAAALKSEYVARVSDFGTLDTGAPYIVMELLEGCDLDELRKKRGPLPIPEAVGYVLDACKAMDEAHAAGIVHRDLKPKNMFLTHRADGTPIVKVLDFGISKIAHDEEMGASATHSGAILGSPAFMSPEQIRSAKHVDARADIYALGAVLFQLLTNESPYGTQSLGELFSAILTKEPLTLREFRPDAPVSLEATVARCLSKDPAGRFSSVRELAAALQPFFAPASFASTMASAGVQPLSSNAAAAQSTLGPASSTSVDGRTGPRATAGLAVLIGGFGAIALVVLLFVGGLALRKLRPHEDAPAADKMAAPPPPVVAESASAPPLSPLSAPSASAIPSPAESASAPAPKASAPKAKPTHSPTRPKKSDLFSTPD
ncbi:serine/threonine protein kinase [Pendulispora brunnea]|uniref:Serine/threonine protein kinase n=1 Tax=Pendulispora brunnea TaxID=2905690 RepID=A0ABZ2K2F7_9BACT